MPSKKKLSEETMKICNQCGLSIPKENSLDFNYCPRCAMPTIAWQKYIASFFHRLHINPCFRKAIVQFHKNEYQAAARTALIVVEERIKKQTRIDSYGKDLFAKAFHFTLDKSGKIATKPKITINKLRTEAERNEHEGTKLLCMGIMQGIRNIITHNSNEFPPKLCLTILMMCDLVLDIAENGSLLKERYCVWTKVKSPQELPPK